MKELNEEEMTLAKLALEYSDNDNARELFESMRWPKGIHCPHCSNKGYYTLKPRASSKAPARNGLYKCKACLKQFTVTVGTILEDSKIPLGKWLMAIFIIGSSKKAISSHQLHRMLGVTYKTAWFMSHRIRHAVSPVLSHDKLKGNVEADEGHFGIKNKPKTRVVALIERGGEVRTKIVPRITNRNIGPFLRENVAKGSTLHTDSNPTYKSVYLPSVKHDSVKRRRKCVAGRKLPLDLHFLVCLVNNAECLLTPTTLCATMGLDHY